jgi:hypothetical protein
MFVLFSVWKFENDNFKLQINPVICFHGNQRRKCSVPTLFQAFQLHGHLYTLYFFTEFEGTVFEEGLNLGTIFHNVHMTLSHLYTACRTKEKNVLLILGHPIFVENWCPKPEETSSSGGSCTGVGGKFHFLPFRK